MDVFVCWILCLIDNLCSSLGVRATILVSTAGLGWSDCILNILVGLSSMFKNPTKSIKVGQVLTIQVWLGNANPVSDQTSQKLTHIDYWGAPYTDANGHDTFSQQIRFLSRRIVSGR